MEYDFPMGCQAAAVERARIEFLKTTRRHIDREPQPRESEPSVQPQQFETHNTQQGDGDLPKRN